MTRFGSKNPKVDPITVEMGPAFAREFLSFVADDNGFLRQTTEELKAQIDSQDDLVQVADAPTSVFKVNIGERKHEIEIYGLTFAARQFPQIDGLAALERIRKRCLLEKHLHVLKAKADIERVLASVNKAVQEKHPGATKFTIENLSYANMNVRGNVNGAFELSQGEGKSPIICSIEISKGKITATCSD